MSFLFVLGMGFVVASIEHGNEDARILFDSGAAANCCPSDFAPEFSLLQLDKKAVFLDRLQTFMIGNLLLLGFEGKPSWLNFYVCGARLLQQGCKATLTFEGSRLESPSGESMPVIR